MPRKLFRDPVPKKERERPLEQQLQNHICMEFDTLMNHGWVFDYAGDMNAAKRTIHEALWAKATGMKAGEPDLRVNFPGARLIYIELKVKVDGHLKKHQKARHAALRALGFEVLVWRFATADEACAAARELVMKYSYQREAAA